MSRTRIGNGLSRLLGLGILAIGARFLVAPQTAAGGYGIPAEKGGPAPYLAVKGVRDIASGVALFALLAVGEPRTVAAYLTAASLIPIGDAAIVVRHGGPKTIAYGVHGATAAAMLGTAALLAGERR